MNVCWVFLFSNSFQLLFRLHVKKFSFANVAFCILTNVTVYSSPLGFDKFSSRGLAAPKIAAACLVSARAFIGSVTVRGFNTNLGLSASSVI